jgi:diadenosine tetraphosphate (Ap4A) HIT family hydrolase
MKYDDYLKKLVSCPFCGNAKEIIAERKNAFLKYSLVPYGKDHLLVLPKRHIKYFDEISDKEMRDIFFLEKLGVKILKKLGYKNFFILYREGENSGKSIDHLHFHIVPDLEFKVKNANLKRKVLSKKECDILDKRFKKVLSKTK